MPTTTTKKPPTTHTKVSNPSHHQPLTSQPSLVALFKSQQKLSTGIKNTPQTTKNSAHRGLIAKRNLFQQQKENIVPHQVMGWFCAEDDDLSKQKTVKFCTEKSVVVFREKKGNMQGLFDLQDTRDLNHGCEDEHHQHQQNTQTAQSYLQIDQLHNTIHTQAQQITNLQQSIKGLERTHMAQKAQLMQEKSFLQDQILELKQQLNCSKVDIFDEEKGHLQLKGLNDRLMKLSKCNESHRSLKSGKQTGKAEEEEYVSENDGDQEQLECNGERSEGLINRICQKVEVLALELQFYIDLSCRFKKESDSYKEQLACKQEQIAQFSQQITCLTQTIQRLESQQTTNQQSHHQKQHQLQTQLTSYKQQYQTLKKRHFLLQNEYRKYSLTIETCQQNEQTLAQQHSHLLTKYNNLYTSYKTLYQQYINRSRQTDFIMELNDSNSSCCENSTEVISRVVQEMQNKHGYKVNGLPFGGKDECEVDHGEVKQHKPETEISTKYQCHHMESLSDCSGISRPLENSEGMVLENSGAEGNTQKNGQAYHAKIFLKDLIQLTLLDSGE